MHQSGWRSNNDKDFISDLSSIYPAFLSIRTCFIIDLWEYWMYTL